MDTVAIGSLLGAAIGLILAFTGAGGGILAVPLLVFGLHLTMVQAAPVGLIAVGLAAALGALLGLREGIVRYRAALLIGAVGMLLAPVGVKLAQVLPNAPLTVAFSLVLAYVGLRMWRQARAGGGGAGAHQADALRPKAPCGLDHGRLVWTAPCARALAGTGVLSGLLSGLLGVGGGFVIVPSLTRHTDLDTRSILATSLAVIALVSVGGVTAAAAQGSVPWHVAWPFATGAVLALLIGRRVASRVPAHHLQAAFAVTCGVVALMLLLRGFGLLRLG